MSTQQAQFAPTMLGERSKKTENWKVVLNRYIFHWPLFLISILLTIGLAFIYLKRYKPVYDVKATIIVKDNSKQSSGKNDLLDEIGISNSPDLIENEIKVLKSKQLLGRIVDDLQLWVTYYQKEGLITKNDALTSTDMYLESPVKFVMTSVKGNLNNQGIKIKLIDNNHFELISKDGKSTALSFHQEYHDKFGNWKLVPTQKLKASKGKTLVISLTDPGTKALDLQKGIEASLSSKLGTSIDLAVSDVNEQRGKDILNAVIANYYSAATTGKNSELKQTLEFLDQRLASLTNELSTAEKGIEGFKSSKGLTDISSQSEISLQNLQANDSKLNEINLQLNVINGVEQYVNSSREGNKIPSTIGINDATLSSAVERLSVIQLEHDKMAANMPETNPEFDPINRQLKTTKGVIQESVRNIKQNLLSARNKLQSYNNQFEASIRDIPTEERQLLNIKRQQLSKENTYTYLLQKREEAAVKYASNLSNSRIVDDAYAETPKNKKPFVFLLSLVFMVAMPVGLIYGRNALSDKILVAEDITKIADVKIVGEIPYQGGKDPIAINRTTVNAVSEQLRALRIKLYYLHNRKETGRVTLVTSSVSKEGKSFTTVNLAATLSLAQKRTVVLELDMRKPKIAKYFGLSNEKKGVTDYLNNNASVDEIIQNSGINKFLDVIPCGQIVDNPSELLETKQLKDLITKLAAIYDDVIIDSPPVHLVPDAILLSNLVDVTLYVVRQGFTGKSEMDFLKSLKEENHLRNPYVVFNSIERVKHGYGYSYDESYYSNAKKSIVSQVFSDFRNRF